MITIIFVGAIVVLLIGGAIWALSNQKPARKGMKESTATSTNAPKSGRAPGLD